MRSLTKDQAFDERVILFLAGQDPMRCVDIARGMKENEFDVRRSLIRLLDRGRVFKTYMKNAEPADFYYERAEGGYSPSPKGAA